MFCFRDKSFSGYENIYFSICKDKEVVEDSFVNGSNSIRSVINGCKERIDVEIAEKKLESLATTE